MGKLGIMSEGDAVGVDWAAEEPAVSCAAEAPVTG
jgi:hypothetical protein